MKKILIITDNPGLDIKNIGSDSNKMFCLLALGFSPSGRQKNVRIIEAKNLSQKAKKEAREFYLGFMKELPGHAFSEGSILEVLASKERNLWWYLNLTEKNIWTDKIIHRLYDFLRFYYVCTDENYDELYFYINDNVLMTAMINFAQKSGVAYKNFIKPRKKLAVFTWSYYYRVVRACINVILKLLILKFAGVKSCQDVPDDSIGFFSVYPTWWKDPYSKNAKDVFFGAVPDELDKTKPVCHLVWMLSYWRSIFKQRGQLFGFFKKRKVILLEQKLGLADIFSLFDIKLFWKFKRLLKLSSEPFCKVKGVDVSNFIREELLASFLNPLFLEWLLLDRALKKVRLENLHALFFRLEFQPLERVILYHTQGKTQTYGFQHSALSQNFLNYIFTRDEFKSDKLPLPDYILTTGEIGYDYMKFAGYPENRLITIGPLRYQHLFQYADNLQSKKDLRSKYGVPLTAKVIFVATSSSLSETKEMLADLKSALQNCQQQFHVIVKLHPNVAANQDSLATLRDLSFELHVDLPSLYDYISLSDFVVTTGGTIALEAMVLGVAPIVYTCQAQFVHNPLADYAESVFIVDSAESFVEVFSGDLTESLKQKKENWGRPLRYLFDYDKTNPPQERILKLIKGAKT